LPNSSALAYNELAKFMLRYDTIARKEAIQYAQKAITLARQNRIYTRPPHVTEIEWNTSTAATVGDMYNTLASAYFEEKRNDEALTTFYQALDATKGELPSQAYSQATMLLSLKKQFSEALRIASQGTIMTGGGDNVLMRWHKSAMDSVIMPSMLVMTTATMAGTTATTTNSTISQISKADSADIADRYAAQYAAERSRLLDSAQVVNTYRQFLQRLDRPLLSGTYFSTEKKPFQIDNLKGKVTLIVFWSSWAEPCQKMMPYLNIMFKKFANSGVVNFVVIDTWEDRSSDRFRLVRDYLNRNKSLYFPIFVDDNDILAQKYGVLGVPMRLYIDKLGRIQYKASGFNDSAKLVQEIEDTLGLLLNDQFYYFQ
jgi:thiol-disulfide isomerase/thioredoxin